MNTPGPTQNETLLGGNNVVVKLRDGKSETVFVNQLPISSYPKLVSLHDNELQLIALYTGKTAEWADTLTPESHELIITESERINADFFSRWVERMNKRQDRIMPGARESLIQKALSQNLQR